MAKFCRLKPAKQRICECVTEIRRRYLHDNPHSWIQRMAEKRNRTHYRPRSPYHRPSSSSVAPSPMATIIYSKTCGKIRAVVIISKRLFLLNVMLSTEQKVQKRSRCWVRQSLSLNRQNLAKRRRVRTQMQPSVELLGTRTSLLVIRFRKFFTEHIELAEGRFRGIRHAGAHAERPEALTIIGRAPKSLYLNPGFSTGRQETGRARINFRHLALSLPKSRIQYPCTKH